jgi:hypothetical protein
MTHPRTTGLATMHRSSLFLAVTLITSFHTNLASAQAPRFDLPQPEHTLLERLAGEWHFERLSVPREGAEPETLGTGTISAEMVGDFFVVSRWSGDLYGAEYKAVQSLGYDTERNRYTGDWVDSFMSFRWELHGAVDEESGELVLTTSGPTPTGGTGAFRERHRFHSADSITIIGEMERGESWIALSTTRLTRKP